MLLAIVERMPDCHFDRLVRIEDLSDQQTQTLLDVPDQEEVGSKLTEQPDDVRMGEDIAKGSSASSHLNPKTCPTARNKLGLLFDADFGFPNSITC